MSTSRLNLTATIGWGEHPIAGHGFSAYSCGMKNKNFFPDQNQPPAKVAASNQNAIDFAPSADEVARRAYFSYENEGSKPGRDVQHWLKAEADLLAERNLTRVHGFHNRN